MVSGASTIRVGAPSWANRGASFTAGAALIALGAMAIALALGYRPLVVRSGSMEPEIHTGDVVLSKLVSPATVEVGNVVTFRDPGRDDVLITHRVIGMTQRGTEFSFVTKGDANTGVERWSVADDGTVGRVAARLPKLGYFVASLGNPTVRVGMLVAAAVIFGGTALRRIWRG
jgi:signal peptidase